HVPPQCVPLRLLVSPLDPLLSRAPSPFGHGRRGAPPFLRRFGAPHGFSVEVIPTLARGRAPVSSSRIRRLVLLGQMRAAAQLLGRDYFFRSGAEHGAGRGRQLGFPTANLRIAPNKLLQANGVYAPRVGMA